MNKLIKVANYFKLLLFNPLWYLQLLIPRDNNIWIFGSWYGKKYADNSKCLFEYVYKNTESKCVWITKDQRIYQMLVSQGMPCEMSNTLKGMMISLRARYVIVSSGKEDVNQYLINGAKIINIWHGAPIKKIGLDDLINTNKISNLIQRILYPFIWEYKISAIVSTSSFFSHTFARAFNLNFKNVLLTGYPRNDVFFEEHICHYFVDSLKKKFSNPRIILYLPTFRSGYNINLFGDYKFDFDDWHEFLQTTNTILIFKTHFADVNSKLDCESERIIFMNDTELTDLYLFMKDIDMLITDYSGVYFDFLLTGKPIIFAPFDLNKYVTKSRSLYLNYGDFVCGPIVKDWVEMKDAVSELIYNDKYKDLRKEKNNVYNKYQDSFSSARLYEEIRKI